MTPEELKAAAERVRRVFAGENVFKVYGDRYPIPRATHAIDLRTLADYALSQLDSDGDEAVDKEWLLTMPVSVEEFRGYWACHLLPNPFWLECVSVPYGTTRRQVRQLLAALGISTNESEN